MKKISRNDFLNHKYIKKHKDRISKPCLWDNDGKHVAMGGLIGSFSSLLPMPFQMFLATPLCVIFCGNIPVAISLVWVSNPITMPLIMFAQYLLGNIILGRYNTNINEDEILEIIKSGVEPLIVGSLVSAVVVGILVYFMIRIYYIYMLNK